MPSDLFETYSQTDYRVFPSGEGAGPCWHVRVGQLLPEMEATLAQEVPESGAWVFITAWNPGSEPLSLDINRRRNSELLRELQAQGLRYWSARAVADDGSCSEDSFFVLGMSPSEGQRVGRLWGQVAIVVGSRGEPARLLACEDASAQ